jgi:hypothetical protein
MMRHKGNDDLPSDPPAHPLDGFDFVQFEAELAKRFAKELDKAVPGLMPVAREKIITAHDKALVQALLLCAPLGVVS